MTKITFSGDPRAPGTDPATCEFGGIVFPLNEAVEVTDAALIARLSTHNHFTVEPSHGTVGNAYSHSVSPEGYIAGWEVPRTYRAIHKGRGKFAIVFGDKDETIQSDLTKADAEAFNSMNADEQAAYLEGSK